MDLVMCRSCGEFVDAVKEDDRLVPRDSRCSDCGGRKFKDIATGTVLATDE